MQGTVQSFAAGVLGENIPVVGGRLKRCPVRFRLVLLCSFRHLSAVGRCAMMSLTVPAAHEAPQQRHGGRMSFATQTPVS